MIGESIWGIYMFNNMVVSMLGSNLKWMTVPGKLKQVEVGNMGVFGVNKNNRILYRVGSAENLNYTTGSIWQG